MLYQKVTATNGQVVPIETTMVDQSTLTADCWMIQIEGRKACKTCKYQNKPRKCGGMKIRKQLEALPKNLRFHWLSGDINWLAFGGKWISDKLNNVSFDYYLIIEHINLEDSCGEDVAKEMGGRYTINLDAVAPSQVSEEELKNALCSWGMGDRPLKEINELMRAEILHSYGIRTNLFYETGNNAHKLLKEARYRARKEGMEFFNRELRAQGNSLGHTKMDFLTGNLSIERAVANRA